MAEVSTSARPPALYFVNGPIDAAAMGGGSIIAAIALWWVQPALGSWPLYLSMAVNWPHFAATNYRLYHSRANRQQYPATAWLVPVIVLAGAAWSFVEPTRVAPLYIKFMLLWSPYHFSGQTLGLSLNYARRAGWSITPFERRLLDAFILTTYLALVAHLETGNGTREFAGILHPKLDLAPWVGHSLDALVVLLAVGCFGSLLKPRAGRRAVPAIVLLPAGAQLVWFVLGRGIEPFQQLVPFFHSLQYLFIAWAVQLQERLAAGRFTPSTNYVRYETLRWWLINVVLGIGLFVGLPYACATAGADLGFAMAVGAAAVQLHHFFVDGVIWKLRNSRVTSPLLVTLRECASPRADRLSEAA